MTKKFVLEVSVMVPHKFRVTVQDVDEPKVPAQGLAFNRIGVFGTADELLHTLEKYLNMEATQ